MLEKEKQEESWAGLETYECHFKKVIFKLKS